MYCGARLAPGYTAPLGASGAWLRRTTYREALRKLDG
jgi:hypothetical protein